MKGVYWIKAGTSYLFMKVFSLLPQREVAVFSSYYGKFYNDSPRYIYEELRKKKPECMYIWLMKDKRIKIEGAKVVKEGSLRALYYLAISKLWVDNVRKGFWITKRKGQYYVQTWHGNIALKKIEKDAEYSLDLRYVWGAKRDSKAADLCISGSKQSTELFMKAFWYDGEILEKGLPRSDIFFRESKPFYEKVCAYYKSGIGTRYALYAPTFRVDGTTECYKVDYDQLQKALEKEWGGKWKIIIRLHPNIQKKQSYLGYSEDILNGSVYEDINELIIASDLLITDYSSCMFDGMLAKKRVMLFATDIEEYNKDRGTYFGFDELPFPLARSSKELIQQIINYDEKVWQQRRTYFMNKIGCVDDGHATEYVVDKIISEIYEEGKRLG